MSKHRTDFDQGFHALVFCCFWTQFLDTCMWFFRGHVKAIKPLYSHYMAIYDHMKRNSILLASTIRTFETVVFQGFFLFLDTVLDTVLKINCVIFCVFSIPGIKKSYFAISTEIICCFYR